MVDSSKIFIILGLLLLSAFFSGSEAALFSLSRLFLKKIENSADSTSKRIVGLLRRPRQLLITILLGNTFANVALSSFAALMAMDLNDRNFHQIQLSSVIIIQVILTTALILIFGEIMPKLVAISSPQTISRIVCHPIRFFIIIFYPLVFVLEWLSKLLSKKRGLENRLDSGFTSEEFHDLIQSEDTLHPLEEHEKRMLVSLFRFKDAEISEIYVPRVRIRAVEENQSVDELYQLITQSGYSRIPVYRGTIDDIIGIIYVKDLILQPDKTTIGELMRPAWFVTENMKILTLLNQFKSKKLQIAVVVDEYGGTSGLISLEDILEELVGEIRDEYDTNEIPEIVKHSDTEWIVSGHYSVRQFNQEFHTEIDTEEYDNIAEYLLSCFNHVPGVGESFALEDSIVFTILESDRKSIKRVRINFVRADDQ